MPSPSRLIFGFHAVLARLRHDPASVREIQIDQARNDQRLRDLVAQAQLAAVRVLAVHGQRLDAMLPGARHQGVVATVDPTRQPVSLDDVLAAIDEPAFLLVLDGVQDPHNLGACLRVADAFGVHALVAPRDRAVGLTQAAIKVASGAAESVPYLTVTNLARCLRELKERGIWVIGTDGDAGEDIHSAQWPAASAWVVGAEGSGLRRLTRETCDQLLRIPLHGSVASLNVSVAAGICLYEARRRLAVGSPGRPDHR
ncbi:23S rRNA (guanosine(2251)-2'-O)-methyltransferase RlmB [Accumulibacter sp.]|uniref:23S rRNA (guanosine(2251)-2'-O)-methyltransferase RlmB n=1 Tax=Accumulibacter sp. TaxID=2053492 RepID=UPI0025F18C7D|nr:23S rRNA (guanosine(2251)-2'-O)-methyltransferase RlmB [Accumulibacter sp.]MCM8594284.1 23S rRNA (guanosine(2251)-2'-O)-methyltransferase RlmB [Accumulibacter sp.]MCM8627893.1 23S rRNA (guanosine(2251)-2'-O)-methyltransferase RlmB [Accumulibacter sp.]MDS4048428.1 23S rRNA (guanosine(2251)-2'-O)-methyltransferase RlmB [Accumulibacter sp.]